MSKMGEGHFSIVYVGDGAGHYIKAPVLTTTQRDALTGVEGMLVFNSTTDQLEEYDGSTWEAVGQVIMTTHEAAADVHVSELLAYMLRTGRLFMPSLNAQWNTSVANGGTFTLKSLYVAANTGATGSASSLGFIYMAGTSKAGSNFEYIDWDKKAVITFPIAARQISGTHTDFVGRVQLKEAGSEGALGAKGIGVEIDVLDLYAESYGVSLAKTDIGIDLVDYQMVRVTIVHTPGVSIKWYVDDVLKVTETDTDKIPSGMSGTSGLFAVSGVNGASAGNSRIYVGVVTIWQEA
ncbi:hypothetical protein LCGC14_0758390 [marine sediment metagenome]|uniref:Uncharacterized protein n=1 Tax=marine sediment metagenome TaxID=412755 RepID=A0A0F9QLS8_9ZZZZ